MFNFRSVTVIFLCLLTALIVFNIFQHVHVLLYVLVIMVYVLIVAWGVKSIRSGFFVKAICKLPPDSNSISITFDDGPSEITPKILDILKEHQIQACFFCVGSMAEKFPEIVKRIDSEGHIIGNHSYSHHVLFDLFSSRKMLEELRKTHAIIENLISKRMRFFRPPYGVTNPPLSKAIAKMNYLTIGWSLKSNDTCKRTHEQLISGLKKRLTHGDIVLFHDNRKNTPELLSKFLEVVKYYNLEIQRFDTILNIQAYEDVHF